MYPKEVIAESKRGEKEARIFLESGKYLIYRYLSLKNMRFERKFKLVLKSENGAREYLVIPLKGEKRFLMIEKEDDCLSKKIWSEKEGVKKVEDLLD